MFALTCPTLGIMLARIKLDLPVIRSAILELDDDKLSTDELKAISKQLPTTEEVRPTVLSRFIAVILTSTKMTRLK